MNIRTVNLIFSTVDFWIAAQIYLLRAFMDRPDANPAAPCLAAFEPDVSFARSNLSGHAHHVHPSGGHRRSSRGTARPCRPDGHASGPYGRNHAGDDLRCRAGPPTGYRHFGSLRCLSPTLLPSWFCWRQGTGLVDTGNFSGVMRLRARFREPEPQVPSLFKPKPPLLQAA